MDVKHTENAARELLAWITVRDISGTQMGIIGNVGEETREITSTFLTLLGCARKTGKDIHR